MAVTITGDRELALRFDKFPQEARGRIEERITSLIGRLQDRVEAAAPRKTGKLRSEIKARVYTSTNRVAGYVSVYAPGAPGEYAKAATLEYGSDKPRRAFASRAASRLASGRRRIVSRLSKPVHIEAFRYLRGPFEELTPEFQAELEAAISEVVAEDGA